MKTFQYALKDSIFRGHMLFLLLALLAMSARAGESPATADYSRDSEVDLILDFTTLGSCAHSAISFFADVTPTPDRMHWSFGDGATSDAWSPVHSYADGGNFKVELTAYLNGESTSISKVVSIIPSELRVVLPRDTTACVCELPEGEGSLLCPPVGPFEVTANVIGDNAPMFQWFGPDGILPDQTTSKLRPVSAGYYYLLATEGGCSATAGVNVREYQTLDRRDAMWYFGNNAGIDFNQILSRPPVAVASPLDGATSIFTDRRGRVIISTDGHRLFNSSGQDITPPGGLAGDPSSTQSALIIPVPGDETLLYIFTTGKIEENGGSPVRYAMFDSKLNNGLGGLVAHHLPLFGNSTGRLTGNGEWLIIHEYGNNFFRAYRLSDHGIASPVISAAGSSHTGNTNVNGSGYIKLNQATLAAAVSKPGMYNHIEVFDFDNISGKITNPRIADLSITTGQINGIEVISGGNKVFATWTDTESSRIYEFAPHVPYRYHFMQSVVYPGVLGAIRSGLDGNLYVAPDGAPFVATFAALNDTSSYSNITLQPFPLAPGTTSGLVLPNTIDVSTPEPGFRVSGLCFGQATEFVANGVDPEIDKFDWHFGDGQVRVDGGPRLSHLYQQPGDYTVVVRVSNRCEDQVAILTRQITISDQVPPDPTGTFILCEDKVVIDANPSDVPDLSYKWSTGETTEQILAAKGDFYNVVITNQLGCSTSGALLVIDQRPSPDLGNDVLTCLGAATAVLDAGYPGTTYTWSVNGSITTNSSQTQTVSTDASGLFAYTVTVTDPVTSCAGTDTVVYTINAPPEFAVHSNSPIICNTTTGQVGIELLSTASLIEYEINGPGGLFSGTAASGSAISTPSTLVAGQYSATVIDVSTGCETTHLVSIDQTMPRPTISSDGNVLLSSSDTGNQWFRDGEQITGATAKMYVATRTGDYTVEVTQGTCVTGSEPLNVTVMGLNEGSPVIVSVFPNPSQHTVTVALSPYEDEASLEVYTVQGVLVLQTSLVPGTTAELDLSNYPAGLYLLNVRWRTGSKVTKLYKV